MPIEDNCFLNLNGGGWSGERLPSVWEKWLPSSDILIVRWCTEGSGGDGGDGGDGGSGGGGNGGGGQCDGVMLFFWSAGGCYVLAVPKMA